MRSEKAEVKTLSSFIGRGRYFGPLSADEAEAEVNSILKRVIGNYGTSLHKGRNKVKAFEADDSLLGVKGLAVKLFSPPAGYRRLESLVRTSKAYRAFYAAVSLSLKNIPTPCPVAYVEERHHGMLGQSVLITEWIRDTIELRDVLQGKNKNYPDGPDDNFISSLACFLRSLHDAGFIHRDLSDGNIMVKLEGRSPGFFLLDLNRVRARKRISMLRKIREIIRVGVPAGLQKDFLSAYLQETGLSKSDWYIYRTMKNSFELWLTVKRHLRLRWIARKLKIQS